MRTGKQQPKKYCLLVSNINLCCYNLNCLERTLFILSRNLIEISDLFSSTLPNFLSLELINFLPKYNRGTFLRTSHNPSRHNIPGSSYDHLLPRVPPPTISRRHASEGESVRAAGIPASAVHIAQRQKHWQICKQSIS